MPYTYLGSRGHFDVYRRSFQMYCVRPPELWLNKNMAWLYINENQSQWQYTLHGSIKWNFNSPIIYPGLLGINMSFFKSSLQYFMSMPDHLSTQTFPFVSSNVHCHFSFMLYWLFSNDGTLVPRICFSPRPFLTSHNSSNVVAISGINPILLKCHVIQNFATVIYHFYE